MMSVELKYKRFSRVTGTSNVTPNQILQIINSHEEDESVESAFRNFHEEVFDEFVSNTGREKTDKLKKFRKQIVQLLKEYSFSDVIKINALCIENDGRINRKTFEELLSGDPEN